MFFKVKYKKIEASGDDDEMAVGVGKGSFIFKKEKGKCQGWVGT